MNEQQKAQADAQKIIDWTSDFVWCVANDKKREVKKLKKAVWAYCEANQLKAEKVWEMIGIMAKATVKA